MLETERLILREMAEEDFDVLHEIFSNDEVMKYYPASFDEAKTRGWILRNQKRYSEEGFGLWAVVLKAENQVIGDCGITMQNIHGTMLPEVGYHIHPDYQKRGYASEAAEACIAYGFEILGFEKIYSYMKYTNIPSIKTAMRNGFYEIEEYADEVNEFTKVFMITKEEWRKRHEKNCGN